MRLGILQADSVRPELRETFGDYPDMFARRFREQAPALELVTWNLPADELPASVDDADAWLITGSKWSVYDDLSWIERAHDFVRALHAARKPILGICFGHQLVANALGGEVRNAAAWGVGVHTARIHERPDWMQPGVPTLSLLVSHQDQVTTPPPRARVLAGHAFCPNDMMQIDDHILTFQGHPEFEPGYSRALMELRREIIGESVYQEGMASLHSTIEGDIAVAWMLRFLGVEPQVAAPGREA